MESSSVCRNGKVVVLGLLMMCGGGATVAAATPPPAGVSTGRTTASTYAASSSTGYELQYFHACKATKTYAIELTNGLRASFNFGQGTAIIYDSTGNPTTIPLEQVLLQANNGNVQAAAEMYDQMYQSITAAQSDAVMAHVGPSTAGTYFQPPPRGVIGIGEQGMALWSTPTGDCWPLPSPCHE